MDTRCQTSPMNLRPLTLIGIVISMVTGVALGITGYRAWLDRATESDHARAFDAVLRQVQANYVDDVDEDDLMRNALKGMLGELDDYSLYLDSAEWHDLQEETSGRFGGIGVEIGLRDDQFTIIAPMDQTPAARAGLAPGERLLEIDHRPLTGRTLVDVVKELRGDPGTDVHLKVQGDGEPRDVTLTRAVIELASVHGRLLEPGYAYVRISQFQGGTAAAFEELVDGLRERSGGRLDRKSVV